ncbi:MAG: anaerobic ribonucleoside-triphosphate reductase activating protein [Clostridia bacterium]|nr:anaerobic ribonucleoside-triphosphate reductase activating protein [Clostridia bacterium]
MNYHKIEKTSVANGPGVRVVLWVSGCSIHCCGCHNPETWDPKGGMLFDDAAKQELFESLNHDYIQGITFSGGHPLEPENIAEVHSLIFEILRRFPEKDIWLYTGYTLPTEFSLCGIWEQQLWDIISNCDVIVDGPFIEEQKDLTLPYRGSKNQRVIYIPDSYIKDGTVHWYVISDEEIRKGDIFRK